MPTAEVTAIFKKGIKSKSWESYRPVSLACIACKIDCGGFQRDAVVSHLMMNNI